MNPNELSPSEIKPGLVLHLNPDTLERTGGEFTCEPELRVKGGHFFVCLEVSGAAATWLPLYSNAGVGREPVSANRAGHPKWTKGTFYWHKDQIWTAPHAAVVSAAKAGGDMSRRGARNALKTLPHIKPAN